jgi:hypothetical protein
MAANWVATWTLVLCFSSAEGDLYNNTCRGFTQPVPKVYQKRNMTVGACIDSFYQGGIEFRDRALRDYRDEFPVLMTDPERMRMMIGCTLWDQREKI